MSKDSEKKPPARASERRSQNAEEQIRQRAYELYEARGREDGHELEDWRQAETEVTGIQRKVAAA